MKRILLLVAVLGICSAVPVSVLNVHDPAFRAAIHAAGPVSHSVSVSAPVTPSVKEAVEVQHPIVHRVQEIQQPIVRTVREIQEPIVREFDVIQQPVVKRYHEVAHNQHHVTTYSTAHHPAYGYAAYAHPAYSGYAAYAHPAYSGYAAYAHPAYSGYAAYAHPAYSSYSAFAHPGYSSYAAYAHPAYGSYASSAHPATFAHSTVLNALFNTHHAYNYPYSRYYAHPGSYGLHGYGLHGYGYGAGYTEPATAKATTVVNGHTGTAHTTVSDNDIDNDGDHDAADRSLGATPAGFSAGYLGYHRNWLHPSSGYHRAYTTYHHAGYHPASALSAHHYGYGAWPYSSYAYTRHHPALPLHF